MSSGPASQTCIQDNPQIWFPVYIRHNLHSYISSGVVASRIGHTHYGSGNLLGSANQGILGILFLNPTLQELDPSSSDSFWDQELGVARVQDLV